MYLYRNPLVNSIAVKTHYVVFMLSLLILPTLLYLITFHSRKEMGRYRILLFAFVFCDLYYAIVDILVMHVPESWGVAFFMAGHGIWTGKFAISWFGSVHSHLYVVLFYLFLYRYLAVTGSRYFKFFECWWLYCLLLILLLLFAAIWFCVLHNLYDVDDFVREYTRPLLHNETIGIALPIEDYITAVFCTDGAFHGPRLRPISGLLIMLSMMMSGFGFMIFAAVRIMKFLSGHALSKKTADLQSQLFMALMFQMILPFLTAFSPPLFAICNPFLGIPVWQMSVTSPLLCSIHPWLDGAVLIYTIRDYRNALNAKIRRSTSIAAKSTVVNIEIAAAA